IVCEPETSALCARTAAGEPGAALALRLLPQMGGVVRSAGVDGPERNLSSVASRMIAPSRLMAVERREDPQVLGATCGLFGSDDVVEVGDGDLDTRDDNAMRVPDQLRVAAVEGCRTKADVELPVRADE